MGRIVARVLIDSSYTLSAAVALAAVRVLFANGERLGHAWLAVRQLEQFGDLVTAWGLPMLAGALLLRVVDSDWERRPLGCAVALSVLIGLLQWRASSDLNGSGTLQLEMPVAVLTGAAAYWVWWIVCRGAVRSSGLAWEIEPLSSRKERGRYAVLLGLVLMLGVSQYIAKSVHLRLSASDRTRVRRLHAVVFVSEFCPHCRRLMAWLTTYKERHPGLQIEILEEQDPRNRLLRERLAAAFDVPIAQNGIPAIYTAAGFTEGDTPAIAAIQTAAKPDASILGKVLDRGHGASGLSSAAPIARESSRVTLRDWRPMRCCRVPVLDTQRWMSK